MIERHGVPGGTRTHGPQIRKLVQSVENTDFSSKPPDFLDKGNQGVTGGSANQEGGPSTLKNETAAQAGPLNGGKIGKQSDEPHAHLSSASTAATTDEVAVRWRIGDVFQDRAGGRVFTYRLTYSEVIPVPTHPVTLRFKLVWRGNCAICGERFMAISGRDLRGLARTCLDHRAEWEERAASAEGRA